MTVFYSHWYDNTRRISFCRYMGDMICDAADISYWVVPGTLNMED